VLAGTTSSPKSPHNALEDLRRFRRLVESRREKLRLLNQVALPERREQHQRQLAHYGIRSAVPAATILAVHRCPGM